MNSFEGESIQRWAKRVETDAASTTLASHYAYLAAYRAPDEDSHDRVSRPCKRMRISAPLPSVESVAPDQSEAETVSALSEGNSLFSRIENRSKLLPTAPSSSRGWGSSRSRSSHQRSPPRSPARSGQGMTDRRVPTSPSESCVLCLYELHPEPPTISERYLPVFPIYSRARQNSVP